jgi:hypothetical protein
MCTLQGRPLVPNFRIKGIVRCVMILCEIREKDEVEFCCREQYVYICIHVCVCVRVCTSFHRPVRTSPEGKNRDPSPSFSPSLQLPEYVIFVSLDVNLPLPTNM